MNNVLYNVNTDVVTSNNYYITLQNSYQQQSGTPVQFSAVLLPTYLSSDMQFVWVNKRSLWPNVLKPYTLQLISIMH